MWQIKEMIALAMLGICAYTDIRERNIYIVPLAISAIGACTISVTAYIGMSEYRAAGKICSDLLFPAVSGILIIAVTSLFKKHIGEGDGYMIACLGLILGNRYSLYATAAGCIAMTVYTLMIMARKKRRPGYKVPFAPFVMSGFIAVLFNEI